MEANRVSNFINFILEETEENNKIIDEELKEAGLNTEKFQKKMLETIEARERNLRYEKGKKLKEIYKKIKERIQIPEFRILNVEQDYKPSMAFRNLTENLSENEIENIMKDDYLLNELIEKMKSSRE